MRLPTIRIGQKEISSFEETIRNEWLVTNGLGGYSSSTVLGINTRKYHGLLVAALSPPGNRTICLAKLDEEASVGDNVYSFNSNEFQGKIYPEGYMSLKKFSVSPFPKFVYAAGNVTVEKTIFMPSEKNAVIAIYNIQNQNTVDCRFRIYPLLSSRHFHSVIDRQNRTVNLKSQVNAREVEVTANDATVTIIMAATEGKFVERSVWIDRLYYREEADRVESSLDDCWQPGYFGISIQPRQATQFAVIAAADKNKNMVKNNLKELGETTEDANRHLEKELAKREDIIAKFYRPQAPVYDWLSWLLLAADSFVVKTSAEDRSVIAGYHWFEAWGRDTFISFPGLVLVTRKYEDARRILFSFMRDMKNGLIPDLVVDKSAEPVYNTVDATLWYINAVLQYVKYTGDFEFVHAQLWQKLKDTIENHEKGTDFGIRMDTDSLLAHGPRLTWMDCQVDGNAVTPRAGKAVEVQALWYNALRTMQVLADEFNEKNLAEKYANIAAKARESFNRKFWNAEKNCLFDVVEAAGADPSSRPNQIIAASLEHAILDRAKAESVVDFVHREFLTPCGLRTLAPSDPRYKGVCIGERGHRDKAYHNGTIWPWLLGPFTTAYIRAKGGNQQSRKFALANFLMPLFSKQAYQAGLGTISEIFDGDPPHTPRGCISQAWSVAELLRAYMEDVLPVRPKFEPAILQA